MRIVCFLTLTCLALALNEERRHAGYLLRNHTWPLVSVHPNTDGWRYLMFRRLAQVERIKNTADRYNGFYTTMSSAITCPNFTASGWGLTRVPSEMLQELQESLKSGLANVAALQEEPFDPSIVVEGKRPYFIPQPDLNKKILHALLPIHEKWAGIPLFPSLAYGLRVYTNNSRLLMHIDRLDTHVISGILHVGQSVPNNNNTDDGNANSSSEQPWPLVLEDFWGNTNEIFLKPGDLLLYESSKCWHGRPRQFHGSWYSSLFLHYRPASDVPSRVQGSHGEKQDAMLDAQNRDAAMLEAHYAIPPHWKTAEPPDERLEELEVVGTSFREPTCPNEWCGTIGAVQWHGPGIEGKFITSTGLMEKGGKAREFVTADDEL
ncbi:hypothetical protein MHU86_14181 [Fragilaria crotonensis]|nr:hypothetical protein MHU86_14181 [Fragilaria crotonensis]